ncbi:hypothetical protein ACC794_37625, partial [Rhizobium ruizarguesonis]
VGDDADQRLQQRSRDLESHGFAQSFFQVGGNAGQAIGPLLAAFIVLPLGQHSVSWFADIAMVGMLVLSWVGNWYMSHRRQNAS